MRQVPDSTTRPLGIVGNGRVAHHLQHYFQLLDLPVRTWDRRRAFRDPDKALRECGTVLVLVADRAIEPFIRQWPALTSHVLVHCSGSLVTPLADAAHPLMTFGDTLYDLETYRRVPFIVDAGRTPFASLLPGLPNAAFTIPAADRPLYHALCVLAGNGSTLLWQKLFHDLEARFGIPARVAFPFAEQVATNLRLDGRHALTGPLSRGDGETVQANLHALEGDPFHAVYHALARAYAHRA